MIFLIFFIRRYANAAGIMQLRKLICLYTTSKGIVRPTEHSTNILSQNGTRPINTWATSSKSSTDVLG